MEDRGASEAVNHKWSLLHTLFFNVQKRNKDHKNMQIISLDNFLKIEIFFGVINTQKYLHFCMKFEFAS